MLVVKNIEIREIICIAGRGRNFIAVRCMLLSIYVCVCVFVSYVCVCSRGVVLWKRR